MKLKIKKMVVCYRDVKTEEETGKNTYKIEKDKKIASFVSVMLAFIQKEPLGVKVCLFILCIAFLFNALIYLYNQG